VQLCLHLIYHELGEVDTGCMNKENRPCLVLLHVAIKDIHYTAPVLGLRRVFVLLSFSQGIILSKVNGYGVGNKQSCSIL